MPHYSFFKDTRLKYNGIPDEITDQIFRGSKNHPFRGQLPRHYDFELSADVDRSSYVYFVSLVPRLTSIKYNTGLEYFQLPPLVIKDIHAGRCKLLVDVSTEGHDITHQYVGWGDLTHHIICNTMEIHNFHKHDVILCTANLKPYTDVPYTVVSLPGPLWWPNCYKNSSEYQQQLSMITGGATRPKKLLSWCRAVRPHRFRAAQTVFQWGLHHDNIFTMPGPVENFMLAEHQNLLSTADKNFLDSLPWIYDVSHKEITNPVSMDHPMERQAYTQTYVSFVLETYLYNTSNTTYELDISEKTTKPITMLHPFIVMGQPGTLAYLRDQGFKTFDQWWDESYDRIRDHERRWQMTMDLYQQLNSKSHQQLAEMMREMLPVLLHNFEHYSKIKNNKTYLAPLYSTLDRCFINK